MKKFMLIMWQLPQSIVFWCAILHCRIQKINYTIEVREGKKFLIHSDEFMTSAGLGEFVLLNKRQDNSITINHELGHCKQSQYLGWTYLLIVGLPSVVLNLLSRKDENIRSKYYTYFPENWADKLGNVNR